MAVGTPEDVAASAGSYTGEVLAPLLGIARAKATGAASSPAKPPSGSGAKRKAKAGGTKSGAAAGASAKGSARKAASKKRAPSVKVPPRATVAAAG